MDVKRALVIGSGPIVIGQSAEFDYSGTQACKALREEGVEVILVNSNPATIQTDRETADVVYIEPLDVPTLKKIIQRERPDALLATMGGQTALNLAIELDKWGVLEQYNVRLIGTGLEAIEKAESREKFNALMEGLGIPILPGFCTKNMKEGLEAAERIGYPVVARPAYTLGGTGGGFASCREELEPILEKGFMLSRSGEVLIEKSALGWGEFEYEVIRDSADNAIVICNMENFDPMGVHTGESIVVAPAQTLSDRDHQMLRDAALKIVRALKIEGGCNVQFYFNQETGQYGVIEVNPRLSRSSALASKATGYPIARVAAKIALGKTLDGIRNPITNTTAAFEPALDYVVTKIPKWPFEKFRGSDRRIGTQMKSTGEAMAIGRTFEESLLKAIRGLDLKEPKIEKPEEHLFPPTDLRIFAILEAFRRGAGVEEIRAKTRINPWFLGKVRKITEMEKKVAAGGLKADLLREAKRMGFSDAQVGRLVGKKEKEVREFRKENGIIPAYKIVDSCAGEFEAITPYFYSTYEDENEAVGGEGRKILVIGSGPIRIGQGIEFDYCCSQAAMALRRMGLRSIMVNNNPETMSTDFDSSDRLYFEPLTFEDVMNFVENEGPEGVIVQLGGQTSINLAEGLVENGVNVLGTGVEGIDIAEDREKFRALCGKFGIRQPLNATATGKEGALKAASEIGYPVVVRPSYVIAGRGMQIVFSPEEMEKFIGQAVDVSENRPVLIDKYLDNAFECEVDAVSDSENTYIGGIMEHVEFAGVHSGDANISIPSLNLSEKMLGKIRETTRLLARELGVKGFVNIQYAVRGGELFMIEANPRASRTVPFLSKATGVPLVEMAVRAMLGEKVENSEPSVTHYAIKGVVFPFLKISGADISLGPEMKSTGETMGLGGDFESAYLKALQASGISLPKGGAVLLSLRKEDREDGVEITRKLAGMGFEIYATPGTGVALTRAANVNVAKRMGEKCEQGEMDVLQLISSGEVQLVVNTPTKSGNSFSDGFKIRRRSIEKGIPCVTNIRTAMEFVKALEKLRGREPEVRRLGEYGG
ncbi:MAG: carbamoyl-phosphate synthase large subunit [Candidatus ainarchaeum sp.]|nr:carbamoyl-phosphate synthase large subunit [Candidatus ainarchaeum sp.]